jgi:hypothetical protein
MNKSEENLNAWLEGRLTGQELADFEASLPEISEAELAQQEDRQLTALLKKHISAPAMTNQEFFNHQLLNEIEAEMPAHAEHEFAEPRRSWWSISRLVWTGAASLAIFTVCTFFVVQQDNPAGQSSYLTQITNARITDPAASPDATITMFESKEEKATVLWVDGLQSLPSEYAAK